MIINASSRNPAVDFAPLHEALALRDARMGGRSYRSLSHEEIQQLTRQGNHSNRWDLVLVSASFDPARVRDCAFEGLVRIGDMTCDALHARDLALPVGLYRSRVVASDIGDDCALHDVGTLARFLVQDRVLLFRVGELTTGVSAHFGQGLCPDSPSAPWINVWNECGGRRILPFAAMRSSDAWFQARHPGDAALQERLRAMTAEATKDLGPYSELGDDCAITHTDTVCNVLIGASAAIRGAARIENVTIRSHPDAPALIGSGVDMVEGIAGFGCQVERQSMVRRFVLGQGVKLDFGARVEHVVIGDCSTIECGEMRNALCFAHHGQHHSTGFLIAACVEGQCNLAAGATVGSNHNSRRADGELLARRGFWPGLNTSFKHNSHFASFTLAAKGDYPAEIDLRLPFSLISNEVLDDSLNILPAFAFLHNMYALARNDMKFRERDHRAMPSQPVETSALAPDTVEEMFEALALLEEWTGRAWCAANDDASATHEPSALREKGRRLLADDSSELRGLDVLARGVEKSRRAVRVHRPEHAWRAYCQMIHIYAVRTLLDTMEMQGIETPAGLKESLTPLETSDWVNAGGQILSRPDLESLKEAIVSGQIETWDDFHAALGALQTAYPLQKARHALSALLRINGQTLKDWDAASWAGALALAREIQERIVQAVHTSRGKDYTNPFRLAAYDSPEQRDAVTGPLDLDPVIQSVEEDARRLAEKMDHHIHLCENTKERH